MTIRKVRVAVFVSGRGTNLRAMLAYAEAHPDWPVEIALVVSDKPDCPAFAAAEAAGVPTIGLRPADFSDKPAFERAVVKELQAHQITGIALAGYMRILGETLLFAYPDRILNIHPSLLPQFPGKNAVAAALAARVNETGVTIHLVDAGVDTGRIIRQESVPVDAGMTEDALLTRIHAVEHRLYPVVLGEMAAAWLNDETSASGDEEELT